MRNTFLTLSILVFSQLSSIAQYDGYRGIYIDSRINLTELQKDYDLLFYPTYNLILKLRPIKEQKICNYVVDYIDIKLKPDSTIDYLEAYTNVEYLENTDDFDKKYQSVITCIVNSVGKIYEYESGVHDKEGRTHVSWKLKNDVYLVLYGKSPRINQHWIEHRFKIVWFKAEPQKMW